MNFSYYFFGFLCSLVLFNCDSNNSKIKKNSINPESQVIEKLEYDLNVIFPFEEIDTIEPKGEIKRTKFNSDKGYKYYAFSDSIKINNQKNFSGHLFYILTYNDLHNPNRYLAYISPNKSGYWLGVTDTINNFTAFNTLASELDIDIKDEHEAIKYALFYLRISNDGNLRRFYLRNIEDIWLLAQYYDNLRNKWNLHSIDELDGKFLHSEMTKNSKLIKMKPERFADYSKIYNKYKDIIYEPKAKSMRDTYIVSLFVWGHFSGNLEKWEIQFSKTGKILSLHEEVFEKRIGQYRGGPLAILTFPDN